MSKLTPQTLTCGKHLLNLDEVAVMGVLNVTPDSFSDGGKFNRIDAAVEQAGKMLAQGAAMIDVGGESTRPGATPVSLQEELDRVCPVVEAIINEFDALVSVDTSSPQVMHETLAMGAGMINDVRAFQREGALEAVKHSNAALCVMHMQGKPDTMQQRPHYADVVEEVSDFFDQRLVAMQDAGVATQRIVLDPGFGFGKSLDHNLMLLKRFHEFGRFGLPLLAGLSRKSMLGLILNKPVEERLIGSVAGALLAAQQGAGIVRVHDVAETVDALRVLRALKQV